MGGVNEAGERGQRGRICKVSRGEGTEKERVKEGGRLRGERKKLSELVLYQKPSAKVQNMMKLQAPTAELEKKLFIMPTVLAFLS